MPTKSRLSASIKNTVVAITSQIVSILFLFIVQTVFIRTLGSEYLGANGLFTNLMSFLSFAELGIGSAMTYSLYKPLAEHNERQIAAIMQMFKKTYNIIGITILVVGIVLAYFVPSLVKTGESVPNIQILFVLFLLSTVVSYFFSFMRSLIIANQDGYIDSLNQLIFSTVQAVAQIIILLVTHQYMLFLIIKIVMTLLANISISRLANKQFPFLKKYSKERVPTNVIKYVRQNILGTISSKIGLIIVTGTDNLLISKFIGLGIVGVYSNYMLIINGLVSVANQLGNAVIASFGNLGATESNHERQTTIFFRYMYIVAFSTFVLCTVLYIVIQPFIILWIGHNFVFPKSTLLLLIINLIFSQFRPTLPMIGAYGLFWGFRYKSLIEAFINFVISFILITKTDMGVNGVLIGTIASNVLVNSWWDPWILYRGAYDNRGIAKYFVKFLSYLFVMGGMVLFLTLLGSTIIPDITSFLGLILLGFVSTIITIFIFLLIFSYTEEEKYFIEIISRKYFNKYL